MTSAAGLVAEIRLPVYQNTVIVANWALLSTFSQVCEPNGLQH